uniref:Uncharacterized protein n=1 Tax=Ascaris lumbricoides TaxID=6252 RepID=A0A0M3I4I2_ASCLU
MAAADVDDSVAFLSNQYRSEFNDLRRRTLQLSDAFVAKARACQEQLKDIQPVISKEKDELLATLQDQSEIATVDRNRMLATFTWTGVMLTGMTAGCIFSRYVLAPFLSFFISEFYASLAAYVVIPFIAFRYFTGPVAGEFSEVDKSRRHSLLAIAIAEKWNEDEKFGSTIQNVRKISLNRDFREEYVDSHDLQGVLKGYLFSQRFLPGVAPFSFIAPFSIGFGCQLASSYISNDRMKLIAVTMGTSLAIHLGMGMATGYSLGFLALTLLYAAAGFGMLQMYLKYGDGDHKTHAYQVAYMLAVVYSQAIVFTLFTVDANGLSEAN